MFCYSSEVRLINTHDTMFYYLLICNTLEMKEGVRSFYSIYLYRFFSIFLGPLLTGFGIISFIKILEMLLGVVFLAYNLAVTLFGNED